MAQAQFADNWTSTLSASYTSGGISLTVADASLLPSSGDYYVSVQSEGANTMEVFKVTARSGNVLTVVGAQGNTSASNHASGATVQGTILTSGAITQLRADMLTMGTRASLPASPGVAGSRYKLSDGPYEYISDGTSWRAFVHGYPVTEPILTDFTWVNQGTATTNTTGGGIAMITPSGSENNRLLVKSAPTAPYTVTIAMTVWTNDGNYEGGGMLVRNNTSGKFIVWKVGWSDGLKVLIDQWNSPTSYSFGVSGNHYYSRGPMIWLRITDNATNRIYYLSYDGINFTQVSSESRTTFITPDQIGIFVHNNAVAANLPMTAHFYHWSVT